LVLMSNLSGEKNRNSGISNQDEYPIILYSPNLQDSKAAYFFSQSQGVAKFTESLGRGFLLIVTKDIDEESLLEDLKKNDYQKRRLADFEEESILKGFSKETPKSSQVYVFYTREELEIFRNEDIEEEMAGGGIKEMQKEFQEEFVF